VQSTSSVHLNYLGVCCRRLVFALAAVSGLATSGCDGHRGADGQPGVSDFGIKGSGVLQTEQRPVGAFSRIAVSSVVKLHWKRDQEPSVEVTLEDNLLPLLVTEVEGGTLTIRFKENINPTKEIVVTASAADLDALDGQGAVDCTLEDVKSSRFELRLGGTSQCTMSGSAQSLLVDCQGASAFTGQQFEAGATNVSTSGTSQVQCAAVGLESIDATGASKVTVTKVDSRGLKIDVSGTSQCMVSGKAAKLKVDCESASALHGEQLAAETATVTTSGTSEAIFGAADLASASASGASHVTVSEISSPQLKIDVSGTSECTIAGTVDRLTVVANSASAVHGRGLKAQSVEVETNGTSQVEVEAVQSISGNASGAASVICRGNPRTQRLQTTGTASLRKE
jgi:hypothetical protein